MQKMNKRIQVVHKKDENSCQVRSDSVDEQRLQYQYGWTKQVSNLFSSNAPSV